MRLVDFLANFVYNVYARNYKFLEASFIFFFGHIYLVPLQFLASFLSLAVKTHTKMER